MSAKKALVIAAPASGSGKTVLTLALLRALRDSGIDIAAAKAGPDYIDPGFHAIASGTPSVNLDPWAMKQGRLKMLAEKQPGSHLLIEGMMGLFDGAADGSGSAAALAKTLSIPFILIVDAAKQSHSIAALVRGFRDHDKEIQLAGVILNKVGSPRHETMLRQALEGIGVSVLGAVPRNTLLELPERHLGLVQADETEDMVGFIRNGAKLIAEACDLKKLSESFLPLAKTGEAGNQIPPPGQRIAIARDEAFSFVYPHMLADWRAQNAELAFFSPLENEAPDKNADAVFLPGGYPELHAGKISRADRFKQGLKSAADQGKLVYGECGGYMVLGDGLIDADGNSHAMAGLLRLETSFEKRKLHLGYRQLEADHFVLGKFFKGHEFHYTTAVREDGSALFQARDAVGDDLGKHGLRDGSVMGSYMHLIDRDGS